jgi:wobble nucleotide-excising tRNase
MITTISRLKHPGVLRDFSWPADLPSFGRFNLIYGWNGSGKTTISRMFRALETRTAPAAGEVVFTINGAAVSSHDFSQATLSVRVFNRDFVAESVFRVGGSDVPPILVVGKESVEKQKQIEQLRKSLADAQTALASERSKKQAAEKVLDKYCIDQAATIKSVLRSSGSNPYNNYDKSMFRTRAQSMVEARDKETHRLGESDREKFLAQQRANAKPNLQLIAYQLPDLKALAETVAELLSTTVVSATIQTLKGDAPLSAWVRDGLGLHQIRHVNQCLFCEQELPRERLSALEAHFNAEYEQLMQRIDDAIRSLDKAAEAGSGLVLPNRAEFYDDLASEYDAAASALRGAIESANKFLRSLAQLLKDKKANAFSRLELTVHAPDVDDEAVRHLNDVIQKHNQACDDFQTRVSTARQRLEADSVSTALDEFQRLQDSVSAAETAATHADVETKRISQEIANLEREIVEHRQPAEELNNDLRKYLGHNELCLEIKDTGYTITRNGTPAQALSEGETTAIALLYFLKSLKDRRFELAKGVVVLDDPVSSLDANALYLAFGFIRERTKDAAQLFILTHNFVFFRQVRNWFHHLKGQNKKDIGQRPARFYMLDCEHADDGDQRCSSLRRLDPLLEQFESEYHYLFARIYRGATAPALRGLEDNYVLPNMARRLLEAFLAFRQPGKSAELWQKMQGAEFDETKKVRILRLLHTHSHGDAVVEPQHDPSLLGEVGSVLKDLLEFLKVQDPRHYEAMVELVSQPTAEGDDG